MLRETLLAKTLVELTDTLVDDFDIVELLTVFADRCVEVLDVAAAGIMLVAPEGDLRVMASSSEAMRVLELFEIQAEEGPCLDSYRAGQPVINQDLDEVNVRWPRFAAEALEAGFYSVHALPMRLRGAVIGALNLFRVDRGELTDADVVAAQAFADVATITILQQRAMLQGQLVNQQLQHALNSRVIIEQAKGVVSQGQGLDMEAAFSVLRSYARNNGLLLVDVANDVIGGRLPGSALRASRPPKRLPAAQHVRPTRAGEGEPSS